MGKVPEVDWRSNIELYFKEIEGQSVIVGLSALPRVKRENFRGDSLD